MRKLKKIKLMFSMVLCFAFIGSHSLVLKSTSSKVGYAIAKAIDANELNQVALETGGGLLGAYWGAELGAKIGLFGGPAGAVFGAVIGAL